MTEDLNELTPVVTQVSHTVTVERCGTRGCAGVLCSATQGLRLINIATTTSAIATVAAWDMPNAVMRGYDEH